MNEMQIKLLDAAVRHYGSHMQANGLAGLMAIVGELNAVVSTVQAAGSPASVPADSAKANSDIEKRAAT